MKRYRWFKDVIVNRRIFWLLQEMSEGKTGKMPTVAAVHRFYESGEIFKRKNFGLPHSTGWLAGGYRDPNMNVPSCCCNTAINT